MRTDRTGLAEDFLDRLKTGENLQARDSILAARTKIVGQRTLGNNQRNRISRKEVLKTLITSWDDYKTYRDSVAEDEKQEWLI